MKLYINIGLIAIILLSGENLDAQSLRYDFIEAGGSSNILATFELASLPARPSDIISLTFTPVSYTHLTLPTNREV